MAGKVVNIKVRNPLKLRSGLTGNYHAICHYSYNLPLGNIQKAHLTNRHIWFLPTRKANAEKPKEPVFCQRSDGITNRNN